VHVGTGGTSNLNAHRNSKVCKDSQQATQLVQPKANLLLNFFSRKTSQDATSTTHSLPAANIDLPLSQPVQGRLPEPPVDPPGTDMPTEKAADGPECCPNALGLLQSLLFLVIGHVTAVNPMPQSVAVSGDKIEFLFCDIS